MCGSFVQDDDHDAEEWERYEALHDDVDKQVHVHTHKHVNVAHNHRYFVGSH